MGKQSIIPFIIALVAQLYNPIPAHTASRLDRTENTAIESQPQPSTMALDRQYRRSVATKPRLGVVKTMIMGDSTCYVELADLSGKRYRFPATLGICARARRYVRKKVRIYYKNIRVRDCPTAEYCGKTKVINGIYKLRNTN
jgi:hypothetical protein